jgi:hypothetical protein
MPAIIHSYKKLTQSSRQKYTINPNSSSSKKSLSLSLFWQLGTQGVLKKKYKNYSQRNGHLEELDMAG